MISNSDISLYEHGKMYNKAPKRDHYFYGNGKLLLSGEYFVLDGAAAMALPTKVGQSLSVKYSNSFDPKLHWKSYDSEGNLWLDATFEFWHFDQVAGEENETTKFLSKILTEARKLNAHFLREEGEVFVETQLGFPGDWGLGTSSTLIHNIAKWAYVSPFALLFNTFGGSGYDVACAQSEGPILYQKNGEGPHWSPITFDPPFKDKVFFVYQNKKQSTKSAIEYYESKRPHRPELIESIGQLTKQMASTNQLEDFIFLINAHEKLISDELGLEKAADKFSDFKGAVKSLGAWGGDFIMAVTSEDKNYVNEYFKGQGYETVIKFKDLILQRESLKGPNVH